MKNWIVISHNCNKDSLKMNTVVNIIVKILSIKVAVEWITLVGLMIIGKKE